MFLVLILAISTASASDTNDSVINENANEDTLVANVVSDIDTSNSQPILSEDEKKNISFWTSTNESDYDNYYQVVENGSEISSNIYAISEKNLIENFSASNVSIHVCKYNKTNENSSIISSVLESSILSADDESYESQIEKYINECSVYNSTVSFVNGMTTFTIPEGITKEIGYYDVILHYAGDETYNENYEFVLNIFSSYVPNITITTQNIHPGEDENITISVTGIEGAKDIENKSDAYPLGLVDVVVYETDNTSNVIYNKTDLEIGDINITDEGHYILTPEPITFTLEKLTAGSYTIIASYKHHTNEDYNFNDYYKPYISNATFSVKNPEITLDKENITLGENITISVMGSLGDLTLSVDGTVADVNFTNDGNQYTATYTPESTGRHQITVQSNLDEFAIDSKLIYVEKLGTVLSYDENASATFNYNETANVTFNITLKDSNGIALANKTIKVEFDGVIYNATTNTSGVAQVELELNKNSPNALAVVFLGDNDYNATFGKTNFTLNITHIKKGVKLVFKDMDTTVQLNNQRNGEMFNVTLTDEDGNPLANKTLKIGFNGKVYNKTTDANGIAQLQINIGYQSANTFSITFLGDDEYEGTVDCAIIVVYSLTTKLTVTNPSYKAAAKTKTLKATLKLSNGTAISGKKITFKVNGKYYIATTNSKGVATVKISLTTKKTYTYTASFEGDNQYKAKTTKGKVTIK